MQNHLKNQTSPYLLQHVNNPVDWYPWGKEAFELAKKEDKPVFLSIGYSTCHWCHVMAHESFEDEEIAAILNKYFVSVKVDKEERPDIDSVYMSVCQAMTGRGGWPTTLILTPDQKPFFAGTYFPRTSQYGRIGLKELLLLIQRKWKSERESILDTANEIVKQLESNMKTNDTNNIDLIKHGNELIATAIQRFKTTFDKKNGGFGPAPKFPTPHHLLFLMSYYEKTKEEPSLKMVEKTLLQMYRGGIFDHTGGGFSRYSTDEIFLVPHFEKMLYDNALLIIAYSKAYELTGKELYREIAIKTAAYILKEMSHYEGGFYCAQDADSEGVEGKYYLLEPSEINEILGEKIGTEFCKYFDITKEGNFEGKSIPNLLKTDVLLNTFDEYIQSIYEYRKKRYDLHLDDKILTSWNGLMISALCSLYKITKDNKYLDFAKKAQQFIMDHLYENGNLYVSYRDLKRSSKGFLDDYACVIFGLLSLYDVTFSEDYLKKVLRFCKKTVADFYDKKSGGFFLYGDESEALILKPKDTYDGAIPSGNSMMAYNLMRLFYLTAEKEFETLFKEQSAFMCKEAKHYPEGYSMFLYALTKYLPISEEKNFICTDRGCTLKK